MYMTDINTTLRGNQKKKEDPKKPNVIAKKIFQGLFSIILAVAVFTLSSWQLPVIIETVNCMYKNSPDKSCPYPANENAPPYNSSRGKYDMDPFQAFLNIIMSTLSGGLIGLSRGVKCCPKIPTATAISNVSYTQTFGEQNMSNSTGNNVLVRIALSSGQSITAVSIGVAS